MNDDTIKLLKECDAGTKMAVASIEEVYDSAKSPKLRSLLEQSKATHEAIGNETHSLLNKYHDEEKEPSMMAKTMSWMKTNMKMMLEESDETIADLIFDGCNMGVKSLFRYLNQYKAADEDVKGLVKKLIKEEESLREQLADFL